MAGKQDKKNHLGPGNRALLTLVFLLGAAVIAFAVIVIWVVSNL